MALATPLGTFEHDYDQATGTERFVLSLDMVSLAALGFVSFLGMGIFRRIRSH